MTSVALLTPLPVPGVGVAVYFKDEKQAQTAIAAVKPGNIENKSTREYLLGALTYASYPEINQKFLAALDKKVSPVFIDDLAKELDVDNDKIGSMIGQFSKRISLKVPASIVKTRHRPILLMIDITYNSHNRPSYMLTREGAWAVKRYLEEIGKQ